LAFNAGEVQTALGTVWHLPFTKVARGLKVSLSYKYFETSTLYRVDIMLIALTPLTSDEVSA